MKTTIRLTDNTKYGLDILANCPKLKDNLLNQSLAQLEKNGVFVFPKAIKETDDLQAEHYILRTSNSDVYTNNLMGFLAYDDEQLVINSRFFDGHNDYFFQYLLEKVIDFPTVLDISSFINLEDSLFELFLFLFPHYLKDAIRKGPFKTYVTNQYNDMNLKGSINIARHIQNNTPFVGNVAYDKREFSYDNHVMELIRHTIEFIKNKEVGQIVLRQAKDEVSLITQLTSSYEYYDRRKVIQENKKNKVSHVFYHEYRVLQQLCLFILEFEKHGFDSNENKIKGIIIDGAWLWEEYVNQLIGEWFYHPMNKGGKGAQRLFNNNVGLIYPDFIGRKVSPRIIADAKYKPVQNIGNKDYLQLLAYMFRFEANTGFYFYPEKAASESYQYRLNQGSTYEKNVMAREDIFVTKLGLKIPQKSESYENFKKMISISEMDFLTVVKTSMD